MNALRSTCAILALLASLLVPAGTRAEEVTYTLENVILEEAGAQMFGTFTWTYDPGDFENGDGLFTFLEIPFTWHDHTDLLATFDVGSSIEIVLEGSVHDDGVDITLFLEQPLTPTSGSPIDLAASRYEIGGNGFHTGVFVSGEVVPVSTGVDDASDDQPLAARLLGAYPNPFNPHTTLRFTLPSQQWAHLAVYGADGRRVAVLAEGEMSAGEHEVAWRGVDNAGHDVPSGAYIARLESASTKQTCRLMLIR